MQGDPQVIDFLNKALLNELTAVNQYWLHYRLLDNWGVQRLAEFKLHAQVERTRYETHIPFTSAPLSPR